MGERARGWIRVMHVDILVSMVIYTVATIAFYLLGAGVLHGRAPRASAKDMIPTLSNDLYADARRLVAWLFYLGAIATLYGTIFAATAANSASTPTFFRLLGLFDRRLRARVRYRRGFVVLLTFCRGGSSCLSRSPVKMVVAGGVVQALMLPVVGIGALYLRHKRHPREVARSGGDARAVDFDRRDRDSDGLLRASDGDGVRIKSTCEAGQGRTGERKPPQENRASPGSRSPVDPRFQYPNSVAASGHLQVLGLLLAFQEREPDRRGGELLEERQLCKLRRIEVGERRQEVYSPGGKPVTLNRPSDPALTTPLMRRGADVQCARSVEKTTTAYSGPAG